MIRSTIKTVDDRKKAIDAFMKTARAAKGSFVSIGFHEGAGHYPGNDAPDVVEVALWNEFGTRTTPERSFIRSAIDEHEGLLNEWRQEMLYNMVFKLWPLRKALETMGFRIQVLIQNKIKSNVPPPNADSTLDAKKKKGVPGVTLIDSGLMLRSVTYQVHMK